MGRLYRWSMVWGVAAAVLVSDRWLVMVPGLLGVLGGARLAQYRADKPTETRLSSQDSALHLVIRAAFCMGPAAVLQRICRPVDSCYASPRNAVALLGSPVRSR